MDDAVEEKKRRRNERKAARKRQRYAEEPEFRENIKARSRTRWLKVKDDANARLRDKYANDPEFRTKKLASNGKTRRKVHLKKQYGLSLEAYGAKLAKQGGVCVICQRPKEKRLHVDHNHKTHKLRSLLCGKCNRGLGLYEEDPAALRRAADYLEYWQWRHANPQNPGPPPFPLGSLRLFDPSLQFDPILQSPSLTGEGMTPTDEPTDNNKASRVLCCSPRE